MLKVRIAVREGLQMNRSDNCYSSTASTTECLTFIAMMKEVNAFAIQCDCPSASLKGDLEESVIL